TCLDLLLPGPSPSWTFSCPDLLLPGPSPPGPSPAWTFSSRTFSCLDLPPPDRTPGFKVKPKTGRVTFKLLTESWNSRAGLSAGVVPVRRWLTSSLPVHRCTGSEEDVVSGRTGSQGARLKVHINGIMSQLESWMRPIMSELVPNKFVIIAQGK
ncbi:unnamed protein product, partial [Pleuronectes platessa]